jgi:hypothetical protein
MRMRMTVGHRPRRIRLAAAFSKDTSRNDGIWTGFT